MIICLLSPVSQLGVEEGGKKKKLRINFFVRYIKGPDIRFNTNIIEMCIETYFAVTEKSVCSSIHEEYVHIWERREEIYRCLPICTLWYLNSSQELIFLCRPSSLGNEFPWPPTILAANLIRLQILQISGCRPLVQARGSHDLNFVMFRHINYHHASRIQAAQRIIYPTQAT